MNRVRQSLVALGVVAVAMSLYVGCGSIDDLVAKAKTFALSDAPPTPPQDKPPEDCVPPTGERNALPAAKVDSFGGNTDRAKGGFDESSKASAFESTSTTPGDINWTTGGRAGAALKGFAEGDKSSAPTTYVFSSYGGKGDLALGNTGNCIKNDCSAL